VPVARNKLVPGAPIAAVLYHFAAEPSVREDPVATQEVRVFTVMESAPRQITQLMRSEGDWRSHLTTLVGSLYYSEPNALNAGGRYSSLTAVRGLKTDDNTPIYLLRQPSRKAIDVVLVPSDFDNDAAVSAAGDTDLLPEGIPTSRQRCSHVPLPGLIASSSLDNYDFIILCGKFCQVIREPRYVYKI
jgi:hypothetical protein